MELAIDFLLISGFIITFAFMIKLIRQHPLLRPEKVLLLLFGIVLAVLMHSYSNLHDLNVLSTITFIFDFSSIWLFGPLLLIYIESLLNGEKVPLQKYSLHFIPSFLLIISIGIPLIITFIIPSVDLPYLRILAEKQIYFATIRNLLFIAYLVYALSLLNNYQLNKKSKFLYKWNRLLILSCLCFISVDLLTWWGENILLSVNAGLNYVPIFLMIISLGLLSMYHGDKVNGALPDFSAFIKVQIDEERKLLASGKFKKLNHSLLEFFATEKPYLDPQLSLRKLAKLIELPEKKLSQVMNDVHNKSFSDFINSYRVEFVKKNIDHPKNNHLTIIGIAYDAGFNSKASFNRIFKKSTGMTPSKYKKEKKLLK